MKALLNLADRYGVQLFVTAEEVLAEAPAGHAFSCSGSRWLVSREPRGFDDMFDKINDGLESCKDPECKHCAGDDVR